MGLLALVLVAALMLPAGASAHAYLVRTDPPASEVLNTPPPQVALTYDEAVEPRFAVISVTNALGHQVTTGAVSRDPADPDTLIVPLRPHLPEGWYLIFWRVISVDGHPVEGAFTYAVGPSPGPAPQFTIPSVSATAVTAQLLVARWVMFLSVMVSIGLLAMRLLIARPVIRRVPAGSRASVARALRAVSVAQIVAGVIGLIAIPVYLDFSTANDSLRSVFDLSTLVPLFRVTAFGRAYVDFEACFALFCFAAWVALRVDRPDRPQRSVAELAAGTGALFAAGAVLVIPGAAGHAAQTSPRGFSLAFDWLHLASGSVWLGGLVGLIVLWQALAARDGVRVLALSHVVPRFSRIALVSVLVLLASGTMATIFHMPTLDALWKTSYGVAILVKIGLLAAAIAVASGNLLRTVPRLRAAREGPHEHGAPAVGAGAATLLRRLISVEAVIVTGAVFTAAVLSSLAPPPPTFALQDDALATVGPGKVAREVTQEGYKLQLLLSPNRAAAPNSFAVRITSNGVPLNGANVTLTFNHTEMEMPQQEYQLAPRGHGIYSRSAPALVMVGKWALAFQVTPPGRPPFTALILDQANG